jgi:hypothetical protein
VPELHYSCPRCGARGAANVDDVGCAYSIVGAVVSRLRRAASDRDAVAAVALARCPACHKRPRNAFVLALARIVGNAVAGLLVGVAAAALFMVVLPRHHDDIGLDGSIMFAVFAGYAAPLLFVVVAALGELRRLANVVSVTVMPGRAALPAAVARRISRATR